MFHSSPSFKVLLANHVNSPWKPRGQELTAWVSLLKAHLRQRSTARRNHQVSVKYVTFPPPPASMLSMSPAEMTIFPRVPSWCQYRHQEMPSKCMPKALVLNLRELWQVCISVVIHLVEWGGVG